MSDKLYFDHHIFCCLNERPEGHSRGSCATNGSQVLFNYFKARVKELGLQSKTRSDDVPHIRVNKSGCLDRCECGPVMVVYPEGIWYTYHSKDDIEEIIKTHLQEGKIVERLRLDIDQDKLHADQKAI